MRDLDLRCPTCPAGWRLHKPNALAVRLAHEALRNHVAEHRKISVADRHGKPLAPLDSAHLTCQWHWIVGVPIAYLVEPDTELIYWSH
jgi:hypothetical protein